MYKADRNLPQNTLNLLYQQKVVLPIVSFNEFNTYANSFRGFFLKKFVFVFLYIYKDLLTNKDQLHIPLRDFLVLIYNFH